MTDDLSFLVGSHGRDSFKGLINYEDVFRLDTAYNGSYFTISLYKRAGQVLINN